jgi:hypothetical protein
VGWFRQIWYGLAQAKRKSCCGLAQQILLWAGRKFVWANCDKKTKFLNIFQQFSASVIFHFCVVLILFRLVAWRALSRARAKRSVGHGSPRYNDTEDLA